MLKQKLAALMSTSEHLDLHKAMSRILLIHISYLDREIPTYIFSHYLLMTVCDSHYDYSLLS